MPAKSEEAPKAEIQPRGYPDLHDHVDALREAGLLVEIDQEINKDTEMHPLVRWQFRGGIEESDRKAFLFTDVTDAKGRKYDMPVLVCGLAGSRAIYALGMGCAAEEIGDKWVEAIANPIAPRVVDKPPCQEIVFQGEVLHDGHGLDAVPVPISTPGFDNAPYTTSSHFITKDPDTGIQNLGNYRGQVKAPDRIGMNPAVEIRAGGGDHFRKWQARGEPMPCAIAIGGPPAVSYAAVQKISESLDELTVAGALVGAPINVASAKTVDLLVPAEAEIVLEGYVNTEYLEPESPFGESHGYICMPEYNAFMELTAITRKKRPILSSWISQVAPSESSVIKRVSYEPMFLDHLRTQLGVRGVTRVSMHEPLTSLSKLMVLQFERGVPKTEIWRALYGIASLRQHEGKWLIAVDQDIDPDNADAVFWAMSYRCKPHRDLITLAHQDEGSGPRSLIDKEDSAVLIDATLKEDFPPVSLPKRQYMERAKEIWDGLGLPPLKPEAPWYGYDLGAWTEELERQAELAVQGDFWETGKWSAQRRRNDVIMNTELRLVDPEQDGE